MLPETKVSSIFSSKKFIFWFFTAAIIFIVAAVLVYFIFNFFIFKDELIDFAPLDSIFYAEAQKPTMSWQKNPIDFFAEYFEKNKNYFFSDIDSLNIFFNQAKKVAFVAFPQTNENTEISWALIFKLKNKKEIQNYLNNFSDYEIINSNLIIGKNQIALKKIKAALNGEIFSLKDKINKNIFSNWPIHFYLSSNGAKTLLKENNEMVNNILVQDIYWSAKPKKGFILFKLNSPKISSALIKPKLSFLPKDFNFYFSGLNLYQLLFDDQKENQWLKTVYQFDFLSLTKEFFNQPADLVVLPSQSQTFFGSDFILALPKPTPSDLEAFKQAVKIWLAQKKPAEVKKRLPDNTFFTELIADPNQRSWQTDETGINSLSEPSLNFHFSYFTDEENLFLSNSLFWLKNLKANQEISIAQLNFSCWGFNQSALTPLAIINGNNLFDQWPAGLGVFREKGGEISGCYFL